MHTFKKPWHICLFHSISARLYILFSIFCLDENQYIMTNKCEFVKKLHVNDTLKPKISKPSYTPPT